MLKQLCAAARRALAFVHPAILFVIIMALLIVECLDARAAVAGIGYYASSSGAGAGVDGVGDGAGNGVGNGDGGDEKDERERERARVEARRVRVRIHERGVQVRFGREPEREPEREREREVMGRGRRCMCVGGEREHARVRMRGVRSVRPRVSGESASRRADLGIPASIPAPTPNRIPTPTPNRISTPTRIPTPTLNPTRIPTPTPNPTRIPTPISIPTPIRNSIPTPNPNTTTNPHSNPNGRSGPLRKTKGGDGIKKKVEHRDVALQVDLRELESSSPTSTKLNVNDEENTLVGCRGECHGRGCGQNASNENEKKRVLESNVVEVKDVCVQVDPVELSGVKIEEEEEGKMKTARMEKGDDDRSGEEEGGQHESRIVELKDVYVQVDPPEIVPEVKVEFKDVALQVEPLEPLSETTIEVKTVEPCVESLPRTENDFVPGFHRKVEVKVDLLESVSEINEENTPTELLLETKEQVPHEEYSLNPGKQREREHDVSLLQETPCNLGFLYESEEERSAQNVMDGGYIGMSILHPDTAVLFERTRATVKDDEEIPPDAFVDDVGVGTFEHERLMKTRVTPLGRSASRFSSTVYFRPTRSTSTSTSTSTISLPSVLNVTPIEIPDKADTANTQPSPGVVPPVSSTSEAGAAVRFAEEEPAIARLSKLPASFGVPIVEALYKHPNGEPANVLQSTMGESTTTITTPPASQCKSGAAVVETQHDDDRANGKGTPRVPASASASGTSLHPTTSTSTSRPHQPTRIPVPSRIGRPNHRNSKPVPVQSSHASESIAIAIDNNKNKNKNENAPAIPEPYSSTSYSSSSSQHVGTPAPTFWNPAPGLKVTIKAPR
ncbi:hypothetical protein JR316_0013323 [Psilocybe cubensis]|uniref:Uncharacterized protein n=1 Tax=Psilocybe cubensis TaxID=181762 RepID=A0ACB8GHC8_PSICU|nr:hypothetical protein JR316_0013323 [Psilocybe cubensis]KAH9474855.1 hypothetical protein JR316_0013323 [Psilocybe cubensis]